MSSQGERVGGKGVGGEKDEGNGRKGREMEREGGSKLSGVPSYIRALIPSGGPYSLDLI